MEGSDVKYLVTKKLVYNLFVENNRKWISAWVNLVSNYSTSGIDKSGREVTWLKDKVSEIIVIRFEA